jgi:hypothetical protein
MNIFKIQLKAILAILILICLGATMNLGLAALPQIDSPQQTTTSQDSTIWQLDHAWTINNGELAGRGMGYAIYEGFCEGPLSTLKFKIKDLTGDLHTDLNTDDLDQYAVSFSRNRTGTLSVDLIKKTNSSSPIIKILESQQIDYETPQDLPVEIVSKDNRIQVYVFKTEQEELARVPLIDYLTSGPLSPGKIAFQTLKDSNALITDVEVICTSTFPVDEAPPNLGAIHYKRPASGQDQAS